MDFNVKPLCRVCLSPSDDVVHIWKTLFGNYAIASILAKHFWFQIHEGDGFTEWICQTCWTQTRTFHEFYIQVEEHQKCFFDSVKEDSGAVNGNVEKSDVGAASDLVTVKIEELEAVDSNLLGDEVSDVTDDEKDYDHQSENDEAADNDNQPSRAPLRREEQDAQIREVFTMKCEMCTGVNFQSFLEAKRHYRKIHNSRGYLICCGRKFDDHCSIFDHVLSHTNPDAFRCDQCDKKFANRKALKMHINNHVPLHSRAYKCDLCASSFTLRSNLNAHVRNKHSSKSGEMFPCDECGKNYPSKLLLECHIRGVHKSVPGPVCEICARQFKTKQSLKSHIAIEHSTTPPVKVQCHLCGVWLKHSKCMANHLRRMHVVNGGNVIEFICRICGKIAPNKQALAGHMKVVHGEKLHQCMMCDKAFILPKYLREHVATHTGEDLYSCPYCEKKFKSNANMYSHRKKAHQVECGRDFAKRAESKPNP